MVIKNWSGIYCASLNSQYFEKYWTERNTRWSYKEIQQGNQGENRLNLSHQGLPKKKKKAHTKIFEIKLWVSNTENSQSVQS